MIECSAFSAVMYCDDLITYFKKCQLTDIPLLQVVLTPRFFLSGVTSAHWKCVHPMTLCTIWRLNITCEADWKRRPHSINVHLACLKTTRRVNWRDIWYLVPRNTDQRGIRWESTYQIYSVTLRNTIFLERTKTKNKWTTTTKI